MRTASIAVLVAGIAGVVVCCSAREADKSPSVIPDAGAQHDPTDADDAQVPERPLEDSHGTTAPDAAVAVVGHDAGVADTGPVIDECAAVTQRADIKTRPVDVVFIVDNSSSMQEEIAAVQDRINADFARIVEESGVDYRVIMFSRYGSLVPGKRGSDQHYICVRAPLGASDCADPANTLLQHNPPRFYHYSTYVNSQDTLCLLLKGYSRPDETIGSENLANWTPIAPAGYSEFLRPEAMKHFVVITDDQVDCEFDEDDGTPWAGMHLNDEDDASGGQAVAEQFDQLLLTLSPEQFGSVEARNYQWHSIVGLADNSPATEPWPPAAALQTARCGQEGETVAAGTGYQALSVLTGGLRYPICGHQNFDAVFRVLAENVVIGSRLACEWTIPEPETGEPFDPAQVNVQYTVGGQGEPIIIGKVPGPEHCTAAGGWYYDNEQDPTRILTCPTTCAALEADPDGLIDIAFGCATVVY